MECINAFRIGKITQEQLQKPRPIKILFATEERARVTRQTFVAAKRDGTHSLILKDMWLTPDRTKMELDQISQVRKEVAAHRQNRENVRLSFRRETPIVVTNKH